MALPGTAAPEAEPAKSGIRWGSKTLLLSAGLLLALGFTVGHRLGEAKLQAAPADTDRQEQVLQIIEDAPMRIAVYITGYVQEPGVYWLQEGQRVGDALRLATLDPNADLDQINLAELLTDGQEITVPGWAGARPNSDGKYSLDQITALQLHDIIGLSWQDAQGIVNMRLLKQGHLTFVDLLQEATWLSAEDRNAVVAYTYVDHSKE